MRLDSTRTTLAVLAGMLVAVGSAAPCGAADLRPLMRGVAEHWRAAQLADGALPYGWDFMADRDAGPSGDPWMYVVRQAGAFFFLAEYFDRTGDADAREPLVRGLRAIGAHSLPLGKAAAQGWVEHTGILGLPVARWKLRVTLDSAGWLYRPEGPARVVSPDGRYSTALTGATAVALLAELAYAHASGDEQFAGLREGWKQALVDLHVPGHGFRETPASIDESDYSNGEAWLALARYADRFPGDARVQATLADTDAALMARYSAAPSIKFHHWGAQAAAQRFRTTGDARYRTYLLAQGDVFLRRYARQLAADENNCAAMEGIASIVGVLAAADAPDEATTVARDLRAWLDRETAKLPRMQIQPGQTRLALGGDAYLQAPRLAAYAGDFLEGVYRPATRVDASGHCLSAMVIMERAGLAGGPG